jgi:hypothetical protein
MPGKHCAPGSSTGCIPMKNFCRGPGTCWSISAAVAPVPSRIGGEVVNAGYDIDLQTACLLERDAFALCFTSLDQREGMQAFLDKRQPEFKGE